MKNTLIFSVIGAVAVGGLAVFLLFNNHSQPSVQNYETSSESDMTTAESDNKPTEPIQGKGSLESLLALARNLECSIEYTSSTTDQAVTGTYFTSAGKLRGDFVIPSVNGDVVSSMILSESTLYSWSEIEGQSFGMKMDVSKNQEVKNDVNVPDSHEAVPLEAEVKYNCKPWVEVDGSIFEPPQDILFKDYETAIQGGMEYGTTYNEAPAAESPCSLCERVPAGESRTQCKANFKCQ